MPDPSPGAPQRPAIPLRKDGELDQHTRQRLRLEERAIAARYIAKPERMWPYTVITLVCFAAWIALFPLTIMGIVPLWAGFVFATVIAATGYEIDLDFVPPEILAIKDNGLDHQLEASIAKAFVGEAAVDITAASDGTPIPEWGYIPSDGAAGSEVTNSAALAQPSSSAMPILLEQKPYRRGVATCLRSTDTPRGNRAMYSSDSRPSPVRLSLGRVAQTLQGLARRQLVFQLQSDTQGERYEEDGAGPHATQPTERT